MVDRFWISRCSIFNITAFNASFNFAAMMMAKVDTMGKATAKTRLLGGATEVGP